MLTDHIYGAPDAGYFFDIDLLDIISSQGWTSCAYDRKFFWKWKDNLPLILCTHSDDFMMHFRDEHMYEWDNFIAVLFKKG
jgi:hypothetical protein